MTDLILPTRRGFITSLGALIAAPAVVKASSLMKVVAIPDYDGVVFRTSLPRTVWRRIRVDEIIARSWLEGCPVPDRTQFVGLFEEAKKIICEPNDLFSEIAFVEVDPSASRSTSSK